MYFVGKSDALTLTENVLGNILADFFTNSSGHPGCTASYDFLMRLIQIDGLAGIISKTG
jgi:hypothetical protein